MIHNQYDNIINESEMVTGRRYLPQIGMLAIGGLVSFILFTIVNSWQHKSQRIEFESRSMGYANAVQNNLHDYEAGLRFFGDFFNNTEQVTRKGFSNFSMSAIARSQGIQAFGWNPLILNSERAEYESRAQEEGFEDFMFTERSEKNELIRAAQRDEYVIVYYIEPLADNKPAFGYDIASNPIRLKAINHSFDTGEMYATDRITLVQETGEQFGVLLLLPIYKQNVPLKTTEDRRKHRKGFVVEVLRIGDVIENALKDFSDEGLDLYLYDLSAAEANSFLYFRPSRTPEMTKHILEKEEIQKGLYWTNTVDFAGRKWQILFSPSSFYLDSHQSWQAWIVLSGSLMLTCMLVFYMTKKEAYTADIERRVKKQSESNLKLEKALEEQKKLEGQLLQSQKMDAIGQLAGGIAHDFNNILSAVVNNIYLSKMYINKGDKAYERLEVTEKALSRGTSLTQQLLTFSKGGLPIKKTISLLKIIKESSGFALSGSNVSCQFNIPDDLWPVEADEDQINRVMHNLVANADQSMPEGGIILIRAENSMMSLGTGLPMEGGRYVKIVIQDEGTGISEDHLQKIFNPYFTTKQKGSGLGLAVSYSIIQNHNGYIFVESEMGAGTTFTIYLPASEKDITGEELHEEKIISEKGKILIMDDEEMIRSSLGEMLTISGHEVAYAKDGKEAIDLYVKAMRSSRPFNIVIMDLTIPGGMGGKEAIKILRKSDSDVKAVVSSGYSDDTVMADFKEYGFSAVLPKPCTPEKLNLIFSQLISTSQK